MYSPNGRAKEMYLQTWKSLLCPFLGYNSKWKLQPNKGAKEETWVGDPVHQRHQAMKAPATSAPSVLSIIDEWLWHMEKGHHVRKSLETTETRTFKSGFHCPWTKGGRRKRQRLCLETALTFLTLFILEFEKGLGKSHR